jgi:hypothetical protein
MAKINVNNDDIAVAPSGNIGAQVLATQADQMAATQALTAALAGFSVTNMAPHLHSNRVRAHRAAC